MKPIIHFSHANGFPAGAYQHVLAPLAAHATIRSIDRLGHHPNYPVTNNWEHLERELLEYFERHYATPVIAVGHSLGGVLSYMVARRRPDLVAGLIMLDSPLLTPWQSRGLRLLKSLGLSDRVTPAARTEGRRTRWPDQDSALAYFRSKSLMKRFDDTCLRHYVEAGTQPCDDGVCLSYDPDVEMKIYRTIPDNLSNAAPLEMPAAVVAGKQSNVLRPVNARYMQAKAAMQVEWLPGSHMFPFEQPQATAQLIQRLLQQWGLL
ncbi:alpha/beta hydrolase [Bacterioplanes sanyensis]|uniref:Alpha/beta hydrolase n=1 Tax=Bacterioplanes sanyensis TaxID=1249553 RepID=A0A222FNE7_9GAMM|nr:alpha/beta hydrolase [Bacterioplanes sanyensis]ASP39743.1 alpha/beta hydrolase [Bacterioplanes sanyensis]